MAAHAEEALYNEWARWCDPNHYPKWELPWPENPPLNTVAPAEVNDLFREKMKGKTMLKAMALAPRDGTAIIIFHDDFSAGMVVSWVKWDDGTEGWMNLGDGDEEGDDTRKGGWIDCANEISAAAKRHSAARYARNMSSPDARADKKP